MKPVTLVTLSGFADIFTQFCANVELFEPEVPKSVVTSRSLVRRDMPGWEVIVGQEPFSFPRNANLGIKAVSDGDVLLMNDDAQFTESGSIEKLQEIAHAHPEIGILSPHIDGEADNVFQTDPAKFPGGLTYCERRLCYICVYLKREVIDRVGLLDELFSGYGFDDQDHCLRVLLAGLTLAVTSEVTVKHGFGGVHSSSSFRRTHNNRHASGAEMQRRFRNKWMTLSMASDVVARYIKS